MVRSRKGKLRVVKGGMFCGKTEYLQKEYRKSRHVLAFKPGEDNRYTDEPYLVMHRGEKTPAVLYPKDQPHNILAELAKRQDVRTILIDEVMFCPREFFAVVREVLDRGVNVVAAGLDFTDKLEPFGIMPDLIKMADEVVQLRAVCDGCGKHTATLSYAKFPKTSQIVVGGAEMYGAACRTCHALLQEESARIVKWGIAFPYLRSLVPSGTHAFRVEVGGDGIRVGKSTAVSVIAQGLKELGVEVNVSHEDWQHNPYLKKSYTDTSMTFMKSQRWFARRKWQQVSEAEAKRLKKAPSGDGVYVFIQDVYPENDWHYPLTRLVLGHITPEQFRAYDSGYRALDWSGTPFPDLLIYLRTQRSDRLLERAMVARRAFEDVDENYFLTMRRLNQRWLAGAQKYYKERILVVDTDDLDFARNGEAQQNLVALVTKALEIEK